MQDWGSFLQSTFPLRTVSESEVVAVNLGACEEEEVQCHLFLTLALDGSGQLHALAALPTGRETPFRIQRKLAGIHSRSKLFLRTKSLAPGRHRTRIPYIHPSPSLVTMPTELSL
jgi:hypothetical protein